MCALTNFCIEWSSVSCLAIPGVGGEEGRENVPHHVLVARVLREEKDRSLYAWPLAASPPTSERRATSSAGFCKAPVPSMDNS